MAGGAIKRENRYLREMKKIYLIISGLVLTAAVFGQQAPLSENYFMDKYSLMPSYAGNFNPGYLVTGYRSDWTGIKGGPKTFRLSFNDVFPFMSNAGYGGKIIMDKAGIFNQLYIMGSYSYKLKIVDKHFVMFGLSMGIYHNTINLLDYYNDPTYNIDPSLTSADIRSRIKFMSDFSVLYNWQNLEAGFLFSNISFGNASYKEVALKYNPLSNFQFHATYNYEISDKWAVEPLLLVRGGKYVRAQFEMAARVVYLKRVWSSLVYRDPGIFGIGIGGNIVKGLDISYNFNFASKVTMNAFNNHEFCLGFNIFDYVGKKKTVTGNQ
jgi:type IX secretion system PorP/SprF family membrane protein